MNVKKTKSSKKIILKITMSMTVIRSDISTYPAIIHKQMGLWNGSTYQSGKHL